MSQRFLFYDDEPLDHRFLIVAEWAAIAENPELVALLRVLLSEGKIVHGTVDLDGRKRSRASYRAGRPYGPDRHHDHGRGRRRRWRPDAYRS